MKIEVKNNGEVFVNDSKLEYESITTEFLENIVNQSLEDNVEYILDDDKTIPMVKLFDDIKLMCEKNSDFRNKIEEINESIKEAENDNIDETIATELEDNNINENV